MRFLVSAFTALTLATSALSQSLNTSREFYLHTELKPNQPHKGRFNNLWLTAYHTGAGLNDAVMESNKSYAIKGFQNATNETMLDGGVLYNQEFDLGGGFPYGLYASIYTNFYGAWEPVRVNAGETQGEYFFNSTGLQFYGTGNDFGGWLVCDWWHGVPQLFVKLSYYHYTNPSSCADVLLIPEYI